MFFKNSKNIHTSGAKRGGGVFQFVSHYVKTDMDGKRKQSTEETMRQSRFRFKKNVSPFWNVLFLEVKVGYTLWGALWTHQGLLIGAHGILGLPRSGTERLTWRLDLSPCCWHGT